MFARITKYKMKPGTVDQAVEKMEEIKANIMGLPGLIHFINVANDDGSGYVLSLVESKEISDANQENVAALWANFADFLAEPPSAEGFDVRANWTA